ncbi:MAG TPA: septum formation initiator family protein [Caulobacteraceae bacterium]|nr:septum formation initiator family protein [Caulobacteraceae bacterium]
MLARLTTYVPTVILAALILYFGVNVLVGPRGLLTQRQRETTLADDEAQLKALRLERADLEIRARLLGDASLSKDLLTERAHVLLGFADPRDYVIRMPPQRR